MGIEEGRLATLSMNLAPRAVSFDPGLSLLPFSYALLHLHRQRLAFFPSSASHHELVTTIQNQLLWPRAEVRLPPVASRGLAWRATAKPEPVAGFTSSLAPFCLSQWGSQTARVEQGPRGGRAEPIVRGERAWGVGGERGRGVVGRGNGCGVCRVLGVGLTA